MAKTDFPGTTPYLDRILGDCPDILANGGSCIAGPDGEWVLAPQTKAEGLLTAVLDHRQIRMERQNFDPAGHYSRPDVLSLRLDRQRQTTLAVAEAPGPGAQTHED